MYANALMPNGLDPYLQIAEHREVGTRECINEIS